MKPLISCYKFTFCPYLTLCDFKAGLHTMICRPDLSAREYWRVNRTYILTPDSQAIHENENSQPIHQSKFIESNLN